MNEHQILYNVTIKISNEIEQDWLDWMKRIHMPEVMATDCFLTGRMGKLLFLDEDDGVTYTMQYLCENMDTFNKYNELYASSLQQKHKERYLDRYVAFRSLMEVQQTYSKNVK